MNLTAYRTPGVYFEKSDVRPEGLPTVRVDVAGFVGIAARGPLARPVRIESMAEFARIFGGFLPEAYLAFAVDGFFANGGDVCWVVRVADPALARAAYFLLADGPGGKAPPILRLDAMTRDGNFPDDPPLGLPNPGTWANSMSIAVARDGDAYSPPRGTTTARFSLTIRLPDGTRESWRDLSLDRDDPRYVVTILNDAAVGSRWIIATDLRPPGAATPPTLIPSLPTRLDHFVGGTDGLTASVIVADASRRPALQVYAASPATASVSLNIANNPPGADGRATFKIEVLMPGSTTPVETWPTLSLDPADPAYVETVLNKFAGSKSIRALGLLAPGEPGLGGVAVVDSAEEGLKGGLGASFFGDSGAGDGLAAQVLGGLAALGLIDEVRVLALPDLMPKPESPTLLPRKHRCGLAEPKSMITAMPAEIPPAFEATEIARLQHEMVAHAERLGDRIALLDIPPGGKATSPSITASLPELQAWRAGFDSSFATAYYPWIAVPDPFGDAGSLRLVPPCGHVAGIWARTDAAIGPHASPANATIENAQDLPTAVDDEEHGRLNDLGVNVIRDYAARGIRVMGARTLSTDLGVRFLAVRRLLLLIERSIDVGTQWIPFEPNNPDTWTHIDRVVRSFLDGLWRKGMLDGATAEEAYFVVCDGSTNTPAEADAGRLICLIGVNPPWPAEFVVAKIGRTDAGAQIIETQGSPRRG